MNLSIKLTAIQEFYIFTAFCFVMTIMWIQIFHELYLFFRLLF